MKRILIIEDEVEIADMLKDFIIELGYAATTVYSPTEAILRLTSEMDYDLIISDLNVQGWNPIKAVVKRGLPFLVITGDITINDCSYQILHKPFCYTKLEHSIEKMLKESE